MQTPPKPATQAIPDAKVARYLKLLWLIDDDGAPDTERLAAHRALFKLEQRYPGIRKAAAILEQREQRAEDARLDAAARSQQPRNTTPGTPDPTQFGIDDAIQIFEAYTTENPATWFADRMFRSAVKWGADQLKNAETGEERTLMTLEDRLDEQVEGDVELQHVADWSEDHNGDDVGEDVISIDVQIPEKLWEQIKAGRGMPKRFVDWLDALANGVEEDEDEEPLS